MESLRIRIATKKDKIKALQNKKREMRFKIAELERMWFIMGKEMIEVN